MRGRATSWRQKAERRTANNPGARDLGRFLMHIPAGPDTLVKGAGAALGRSAGGDGGGAGVGAGNIRIRDRPAYATSAAPCSFERGVRLRQMNGSSG